MADKSNTPGSSALQEAAGPSTEADAAQPPQRPDPWAALRYRDYRLYLSGSIIATLGMQMQTTAIGWELYDRTHSAMALAMVGLVQVIPVVLLTLPAGHVADNFNRKHVVTAAQSVMAIASLGLALLSLLRGPVNLIYACLLLNGIARAFQSPARNSLLPQLVPVSVFRNAATWNSSGFEVASMTGPAIAGLLIAVLHGATAIYAVDCLTALTFAVLVAMIRSEQQPHSSEPMNLESLAAGAKFVWSTHEVLASITLDMFAVLLGGAVMLLPIYAKDILHVGPQGFGILRAAPSIGAVSMSLVIANLPPFRHAGRTLLLAVAAFGAATIVFGFSTCFWLSFVMLLCVGAMDNISVVIRHTLVQLRTPDYVRGRVQAVNFVFIGVSNELGGFESGLVASLFTPVISAVAGGVGTILVVLTVAAVFPELRRLKTLQGN